MVDIVLIMLGVLCSALAFFIIYLVFRRGMPKYWIGISIYIELCTLLAIWLNNISAFGLVGVIGVIPLVLRITNKRKNRE